MHLSNPMVYTQFHPVAYMVKLNIEMTMASLIKKIAQATVSEREGQSMGRYRHEYVINELTHPASTFQNGTYTTASARPRIPSHAASHDDHNLDRIRTTKEVQVHVENVPSSDGDRGSDAETGGYANKCFDRGTHEPRAVTKRKSDDELPLSPQAL
jgi:hypothetical protein